MDFHCRVGGEPFPRVLWRRDDGRLPVGRARVLEDRSLRIEHVQPTDGGVYVCEAENDVGSVSVKASLTVHGNNSHETMYATYKYDNRNRFYDVS